MATSKDKLDKRRNLAKLQGDLATQQEKFEKAKIDLQNKKAAIKTAREQLKKAK